MSSHQKKRDFSPKKHVAQQLHDLEAAGIELAYEQEVPLSASNIQLLKSTRTKVFAFLLPLVLLLLSIAYIFHSQQIVLVVGLALSLALVSILLTTFLKIREEILTGKKTMVRGIITDRFHRTDYSAERNEEGKRSARINQYLVIGTQELRVNKEIYVAYRIGEAIELHFIDHQKKSRLYFLEHHFLRDACLR